MMKTRRRPAGRYGGELDSVSVQTGTGGVFKLSVNGQLVLDADDDGFDLAAVTDAIDQRIPA